MKKLIALILCLMMVLSFVACSGSDDPVEADPEVLDGDITITVDELPLIDGATALAPFYELMAAHILDMDIDEARQYTLCSKTNGAYTNLIDKNVDMIFCSMPSEDQQAYADLKGFEFEMVPFLNGGFVFFVNKDNPVDSLTVKELHDIYAGKITNWSEVGGDDVDIIPYQRPDNSGSQTGMYAYVIDEDEIMDAPEEMKPAEMGDIIDAVADYDNAEGAIGYSYYYYVTSMHYTDQIKLVAVEGIAPSDETIGNGTYPLINPSYCIFDADTPENSMVRTIAAWLTSDAGKAVAREAGYVPIETSEE